MQQITRQGYEGLNKKLHDLNLRYQTLLMTEKLGSEMLGNCAKEIERLNRENLDLKSKNEDLQDRVDTLESELRILEENQETD